MVYIDMAFSVLIRNILKDFKYNRFFKNNALVCIRSLYFEQYIKTYFAIILLVFNMISCIYTPDDVRGKHLLYIEAQIHQ